MRLADKAAFFDLPATVRRELDRSERDGAPRRWMAAMAHAYVRGGVEVRESGEGAAGSFYDDFPASVVGDVPSSAKYLHLHGQAPDLQDLRRLRQLQVLSVGPVSSVLFRALADLPSLRTLILGGPVRTLSGLRGVPRLTHLKVEITPDADLRSLASFPRLRTVVLEVRGPGRFDFRQLGKAAQLRGLAIAPLRDRDPLRVPSTRPLAALKSLAQLDLRMVRTGDGSLQWLSALPLTRLGISNWFTTAEIAGQAARHPGLRTVEGRPYGPWWRVPERTTDGDYRACKRCRQWAPGMTTGSPVRRICPGCDPVAVRALQRRWTALRKAAASRSSPA